MDINAYIHHTTGSILHRSKSTTLILSLIFFLLFVVFDAAISSAKAEPLKILEWNITGAVLTAVRDTTEWGAFGSRRSPRASCPGTTPPRDGSDPGSAPGRQSCREGRRPSPPEAGSGEVDFPGSSKPPRRPEGSKPACDCGCFIVRKMSLVLRPRASTEVVWITSFSSR